MAVARVLNSVFGTCASPWSPEAFLPMHWTRLRGMRRRIHTCAEKAGWSAVDMVTTAGACDDAAPKKLPRNGPDGTMFPSVA